MSDDNTRDGAEPSPASAGPHVELHRAVRALLEGVNARYAKNPREWTCPHMQALDDMTQSEPQPTLTDEELEAVEASREYWQSNADCSLGDETDRKYASALRRVIDRLK
jgi:hypothetical protein